jgi:hypothetical protein
MGRTTRVSACSLQRYQQIAHSVARVPFDRIAGRQFELGPCTARGPFSGPSHDRGQLDALAHERRLSRNPCAQILRQLAVVIRQSLDRGGQMSRFEDSSAISSAFMLWMRNPLCRSCPQASAFACMKWKRLLPLWRSRKALQLFASLSLSPDEAGLDLFTRRRPTTTFLGRPLNWI